MCVCLYVNKYDVGLYTDMYVYIQYILYYLIHITRR